MRVAALYDVHGNLPALEAVLAEVERERIDRVVVGGDVVWGPYPSECLELLRARGADFLTGNTERLVLEASDERHAWALERLSPEQRAAVSGWPATLTLDVAGLGRTLFCHATPRDDEEIVTRATPDDVLAEILGGTEADVVVCGHVHQQYDRRVGAARVVNAGSVGLPYEGRAGAFWALVAPGDVRLRETAYDVRAAAARLRAAGMPEIDDLLDSSLLEPTPPGEVTEHFERLAGRGS